MGPEPVAIYFNSGIGSFVRPSCRGFLVLFYLFFFASVYWPFIRSSLDRSESRSPEFGCVPFFIFFRPTCLVVCVSFCDIVSIFIGWPGFVCFFRPPWFLVFFYQKDLKKTIDPFLFVLGFYLIFFVWVYFDFFGWKPCRTNPFRCDLVAECGSIDFQQRLAPATPAPAERRAREMFAT